MYLLVWDGTVHSHGDAGKKDGIVHAGGDDHGSRADEKCDALRNVSVHGESGCGSGDGCGIRSLNSDAMHSGDPGAVVTGGTDSSRRKYAGVEPEFEDHLRLWRRDPDHEPGNDKHTDTLKLRK